MCVLRSVVGQASRAGGTCAGCTGAAVLGVIVLAIGSVLLVVAVFRWVRWRSVP